MRRNYIFLHMILCKRILTFCQKCERNGWLIKHINDENLKFPWSHYISSNSQIQYFTVSWSFNFKNLYPRSSTLMFAVTTSVFVIKIILSGNELRFLVICRGEQPWSIVIGLPVNKYNELQNEYENVYRICRFRPLYPMFHYPGSIR